MQQEEKCRCEMEVFYLGPKGTHTEKAAGIFFPGEKLVPCMSIRDAIIRAEESPDGKAVVPCENSVQGAVSQTLDVLAMETERLVVEEEAVLDIVHVLSSRDSSVPVRRIISHPQALEQCGKNIREKYPEAVPVPASSTAEAVETAFAEGGGSAAISSAEAALGRGMEIICGNINDYGDNKTRFWSLGSARQAGRGERTSMVFAVEENKAGGLADILLVFRDWGVDLLRIESRPAKNDLGSYVFFLDMEGDFFSKDRKELYNELKSRTVFLKVLGSYSTKEINNGS